MSADEALGQRIRKIREIQGLGVQEFGDLVRERVGKGWSHVAVWQVETGKKPVRFNDLVAIADVLACTLSDLTAVPEAVDLGGGTDAARISRLDSTVNGESAMPEMEGWARFQDAAEALADARQAWMRYAHLIEIARRRVAEVPGLRDRITASQEEAIAKGRAQIEEIDADDQAHAEILGIDPASIRITPRATPAMLAARDALTTYDIPEAHWSRRPESRNTKGKR